MLQRCFALPKIFDIRFAQNKAIPCGGPTSQVSKEAIQTIHIGNKRQKQRIHEQKKVVSTRKPNEIECLLTIPNGTDRDEVISAKKKGMNTRNDKHRQPRAQRNTYYTAQKSHTPTLDPDALYPNRPRTKEMLLNLEPNPMRCKWNRKTVSENTKPSPSPRPNSVIHKTSGTLTWKF